MKALLPLILVLLAGTAYGQSKLPACQGSDTTKWSNCFGSFSLSNGNKYVGEFKDSMMHGQGTFYFHGNDKFKGDRYVGEFKDDKRHGQGTYISSNGGKFIGEFKDGQRNGQGTHTYADGNKYIGEYKDNNINGQGTYTWANGDRDVGEFKDGKLSGRGIKYSANGTIAESGIYQNDVLVTSQFIDPNSFARTTHSASYIGRLRAKIKPNITFSDSLLKAVEGNPSAEVEVTCSPSGKIESATLIKSSGSSDWDQAALNAVRKTEALPRDIDGNIPSRLVFSFRPRD